MSGSSDTLVALIFCAPPGRDGDIGGDFRRLTLTDAANPVPLIVIVTVPLFEALTGSIPLTDTPVGGVNPTTLNPPVDGPGVVGGSGHTTYCPSLFRTMT